MFRIPAVALLIEWLQRKLVTYLDLQTKSAENVKKRRKEFSVTPSMPKRTLHGNASRLKIV